MKYKTRTIFSFVVDLYDFFVLRELADQFICEKTHFDNIQIKRFKYFFRKK